MTERKPSATLPRLRVSSHSFADFSAHNVSNITQRTVSSSTSVISTPSNNIRRVKNEQRFHEKPNHNQSGKRNHRAQKSEFKHEPAKTSKKLLNFQQLKKSQASSQPFILHKPADLSHFDYLIYTRKPNPVNEIPAIAIQSLLLPTTLAEPPKQLHPPVRQSQIKAWESAENITSNRIFDYTKPGEESWIDEDTYEYGIEEEVSIDRGTEEWAEPAATDGILVLVPELSRSELAIVSDIHTHVQQADVIPELDDLDNDEKSLLWAHARQQSEEYEKLYQSNHTMAGKRRVQVMQKRAFLQKLFGQLNNVNVEFTTNNSSYSCVDGSMSAQKVFHEDKEEICELLEQQQSFQSALEEVRERLLPSGTIKQTASSIPLAYLEVDQLKLVDVTSKWLGSIYERETNEMLVDEDDDDPNIVEAAMIHLKLCVQAETDETMGE